MSSRYPIVVQGEASETDSDDEVYITSLPAPQTAIAGAKVVWWSMDVENKNSPSFTNKSCWSSKVQGEASETESEDEGETAHLGSALSRESTKILKRDLPPLIVVRDHPDIQSVVEDRPSPTHKTFGEQH